MTTPVYYYCKHCNKQYKTESGRDKHELSCEFNQTTLTLKSNFAADVENARLTANNPLHLFQMLEAAYKKIGVEFIWSSLPTTLDLVCTERPTRFNQKGPYAAITGKCELTFNDIGFKSLFGVKLNGTPFWYSKEFYDVPYMFSFASTTVIALPLVPTMYNTYITGQNLEEQQEKLYEIEIKRYISQKNSAEYTFMSNHSDVQKIKNLEYSVENLLKNIKSCNTVIKANARKEFDLSYPKLSNSITDHATNLNLLQVLDNNTAKNVITPTNLESLIKKLETIQKEYTSISTKYPEAFL